MTAQTLRRRGGASIDAPAEHSASPRALPRLVVSDGGIEALKWLALVLMTLDHVNKHLLGGSVEAFFLLGRLPLPLFSFVLAYNLARPSAITNAATVYPRTLTRLAGTAATASVPFMALGGLVAGWWPLNVLATFAVSVAIMLLVLEAGIWRRVCAIALFLLGGAFVEFWWPALAMCLAAWYYCRRPGWLSAFIWLASVLSINLVLWAISPMPIINGSMMGLLAFPLIAAAHLVRAPMPRLKWLFYAYFPAHLAVIWVIKHAL